METKQAVLPLSAPVSTSILLCFGNRHNHITVLDETIFVSSMTLYQQAMIINIFCQNMEIDEKLIRNILGRDRELCMQTHFLIEPSPQQ
jgi:hypothetical protein